jgi:hypothetical protein
LVFRFVAGAKRTPGSRAQVLTKRQPPAAAAPPIPSLCHLREYVIEGREWALTEAIDGLPWNMAWRRQPYGAGYGTSRAVPPIPV